MNTIKKISLRLSDINFDFVDAPVQEELLSYFEDKEIGHAEIEDGFVYVDDVDVLGFSEEALK